MNPFFYIKGTLILVKMELFSAEVRSLKKMIEEWIPVPERELESTFGERGKVNATTFLAVAQRLKSKGYGLRQEDRMTILTPKNIRFTLIGMGLIRDYCRDNSLQGKPFTVMIKDRTDKNGNVDLDDYNMRVKVRSEKNLANDDARVNELVVNWGKELKAFRYMRRWTFEGKGIVYDLSIIRSTLQTPNGQFKWVRTFQDQPILTFAPTYEMEVELKHCDTTNTVDTALSTLIRGAGDILRGIQKNSVLIRKSIKKQVLDSYRQCMNIQPNDKNQFRGVSPVTLNIENMSSDILKNVANIRNGYNVTDKADGLRVLAYCNEKGELYMIDMAMNVYRSGLRQEACKNSVLDGEWVTMDKNNNAIQQLLLFDVYSIPHEKDAYSLPFWLITEKDDAVKTRHKLLEKWITEWNCENETNVQVASSITPLTRLHVSIKTFFFGQNIFNEANRILNITSMYNTDGLIFTPNESGLPKRAGDTFYEQFKWKPAHDNTVDFLVITQKDDNGNGNGKEDLITTAIKDETGEIVKYKTLTLLVGSTMDPNPRKTVLYELKQDNKYKAIPFTPMKNPDSMACKCYREIYEDPDTNEEYIKTERSEEPIQDKSIVEMRYDPTLEPGWRWIPIRVRHDKTETLLIGGAGRTFNSEKNAESVWNSINEPITETMIRTGSEQPSEKEQAILQKDSSKVYYNRKAGIEDLALIRGLRGFHNKIIKENLLLRIGLSKGKNLLDVACGQAGDIHKWAEFNAEFVLGIDYAENGINNPHNGAYRRYVDLIQDRRSLTKMLFVVGDSSKQIVSGKAGREKEDSLILQSVFGRIRPEGVIPPYVEKYGKDRLKDGADCVACMFALHYFFKDVLTLQGFLDNIRDTLKVGGYFVACYFDGDKIFNLLKNTNKGDNKRGIEKSTTIWSITKKYDAEELINDNTSLGMEIDVDFISIGTSQTENLVPFGLLVDKMKTIGCELLTPEESKNVGLIQGVSSGLFEDVYNGISKKDKYQMGSAVKEYSFLNRWVIFKRKGELALPVIDSAIGREYPSSPPYVVGQNQPSSPPYVVGQTQPSSPPYLVGRTQPSSPRYVPLNNIKTNLSAQAELIQTVKQTPRLELPPSILGDKAHTQEQLQDVQRTFAVEKGPQAGPQMRFTLNDLFVFKYDALLNDKLKIGDKGASRYLALYTPFPIVDPLNPDSIYPSIDHFMAGMKYKIATDKPQLSESIFGREGQIHSDFNRQRLIVSKAGSVRIPEDKDQDLLVEEKMKVESKASIKEMKAYQAKFDETKWVAQKDAMLQEGLKQRWEKDRRFHTIIEAARAQKKYLVYDTSSKALSDLGGKRKQDGSIEGENKVGKIIMELAKFN